MTSDSSAAPTGTVTTSEYSAYYNVVAGESREAIDTRFGLTFATLDKWNMNIGFKCESLVIGRSLCIAGRPP